MQISEIRKTENLKLNAFLKLFLNCKTISLLVLFRMRLSLEKEIERLESALSVWKWKYEELKESKAKSLKQVGR